MKKGKKRWSSKDYEKERTYFFKLQKGCCAICGRNQNTFKRRLNLDHNHHTGRIRGLLCFFCNKYRVGRLDLETSKKITKYLEIEGIKND